MEGRVRLPPPAVKVLASELLSLTVRPPSSSSSSSSSSSTSLFLKGTSQQIIRAETLGLTVSRERRDKFLKFAIDDGTGCVPCIMWMNHRHQPWLSEVDAELQAEIADEQAETVALGKLLRVRGKVSVYRGELQLTVGDVLVERDPNAQVLHWLDSIRLSRFLNKAEVNIARNTANGDPEGDGNRRKRKGLPFADGGGGSS